MGQIIFIFYFFKEQLAWTPLLPSAVVYIFDYCSSVEFLYFISPYTDQQRQAIGTNI